MSVKRHWVVAAVVSFYLTVKWASRKEAIKRQAVPRNEEFSNEFYPLDSDGLVTSSHIGKLLRQLLQ
jgi:hypothetical protein